MFKFKTASTLIFVLLLCYFSLFFIRQVNLSSSDLGRHLKNGEVILKSGKVFSNNLYSFTYPEFEVVNHHWLFGVITNLAFTNFGFDSLTTTAVILNIFLLLVLKKGMKSEVNLWAFILSLLIVWPMITLRTEFRPELFSLLFLAIDYLVIKKLTTQKINFWLTFILINIVQVLWINLHIFFIFSIGLIGLFIIDQLIKLVLALKNRHSADRAFVVKNILNLSVIGICLVFSSLINPAGFQGLLYPFQIFGNYAYEIVENQGIMFMINYSIRPIFVYVILITLLTISCTWLVIKNKKLLKNNLVEVFIALTFLIFAFKMTRLISFAGIMCLPLFAYILNQFWPKIIELKNKIILNTTSLLISSSIAIAVFTIAIATGMYIPQQVIGFGIYDNSLEAANFFKAQKLTGPIFNNYDIGGYLIFTLYPQEKVFVDNRPEAYPNEFFIKTLVPMQKDEKVWREKLEQYQFNTIFFYRHDLTEAAQNFLIKRVDDPEWVPIFVDNYNIIFVRNIEKNKGVIDRYRIPREVFNIS